MITTSSPTGLVVVVGVNEEDRVKEFNDRTTGEFVPSNAATIRVQAAGFVEEHVSRHTLGAIPSETFIIGPFAEVDGELETKIAFINWKNRNVS